MRGGDPREERKTISPQLRRGRGGQEGPSRESETTEMRKMKENGGGGR
jgi:hypothetical protein